ncbi:O-fucosyltransferase 2 [Linum grandiflorum]
MASSSPPRLLADQSQLRRAVSASDVLHSPTRSSSSSFVTSTLSPSRSSNVKSRKKRRRIHVIVLLLLGFLAIFFFLLNWFMLFRLQDPGGGATGGPLHLLSSLNLPRMSKGKRWEHGTYARMLALAAHAMAENKPEPKDLWEEPFVPASAWTPCADLRDWQRSEGNNGYILVTANGGINQQRVAVCNAVVVARLLNSTLVIPRFMYSSVWKDVSQFSDIYQQEHFIEYLKPDIRIVKELPEDLQSLDLEAIGSIVTDSDIMKEAKPSFYLKNILPILHTNKVVHFFGFGNRLAFDPMPFELQVYLQLLLLYSFSFGKPLANIYQIATIHSFFLCLHNMVTSPRDFDADVIFMRCYLFRKYKKQVLCCFGGCVIMHLIMGGWIILLLVLMQN